MHSVAWLLDNRSQSEGFLLDNGEFYSTTQVSSEQVWVSRCVGEQVCG